MTTSQRASSSAYTACAWAFSFALMSLYWALGGRVGLGTLGEGIQSDAVKRKPAMVAFLWLTVALKVSAGLFPLGLALGVGPRWRKLVLLGNDCAGVAFLVYAIVSFVGHGLMFAGKMPIPRLFGTREAVRWHLALWDPHLLLGSLLFFAASAQQRRRNHIGE